jgi:hypothetical protein
MRLGDRLRRHVNSLPALPEQVPATTRPARRRPRRKVAEEVIYGTGWIFDVPTARTR